MALGSFFKKKPVSHPEAEPVEQPVEESRPFDDEYVPGTERYRAVEMTSLPVGDATELVYAPAGRSTCLLSSHIVGLLTRFRTFRTLDEHARDRCEELRVAHDMVGDIRSELEELVAEGLFVSLAGLVGQLKNAAAREDAPPPIRTVGIVTCNRLDSLKRGLASFIDNTRRYGRAVEFVVIDGSDDARACAATRDALSQIRDECGHAVAYGGIDEKKRFAQDLTQETGVPSDVVNFALFDSERAGWPVGAHRNAMLLHTAGERFFTTDDDTICRLAPWASDPTGAREGRENAPDSQLVLTSSNDPTEFRFYASRAAALAAPRYVEQDFLAPHEAMLGRTLADCVAAWNEGGEPDFDAISARFLTRLQLGEGRVLATSNGLVGDNAFGSPRGYLSRPGASRERLLADEDNYHAFCRSRAVWRAATRTTISDSPFFMTLFAGLDNRSLLPPFFPVRRNQDGIFAVTLRRLMRDGYFAFLPWSLVHDPPEGRTLGADAMWAGVAAAEVSEILIALIDAYEPNPASAVEPPGAALRTLGRHLADLASQPQPEFDQYVRLQAWHLASADISYHEQMLIHYQDQPEYWAEDVKRFLAARREALASDDYIAAQDLAHASPAEARALLQRLVLKFGQLLIAWPEIVEGAKRLRAKGQRLAVAM